MTGKKYSTKFKPKKAVPPPAQLPANDEWIARNIAVSFIADICRSWESLRAFRNKINRNIRYAVEIGALEEHSGGFIFGELVAWAKSKRSYASGLAAIPHTQTILVEGQLSSAFGELQSSRLPVRIEDCHREIIDANRRISALEKRLSVAYALIDKQRPMVEKYMRLKVPKPKRGVKE